VFWAVFFPILLAAALGVAFSGGSDDVLPVVTSSPDIARALDAGSGLSVQVLDESSAHARLANGQAVLFAQPGPEGGVVYRFDDTNPDGRAARLLADRAVQVAAGRVDPTDTRDDLVREPGSRYVDFVVPGLVGLGIMSNALWGLGFSIVDSRRRKLMKRLVATPMSRTSYLLSYLVWRLMVLGVEVAVPILSGVFFSAQRFPEAAQPLIRALPLTAVNDALRAHMLQGAGLAQLAPQIGVLTGWLVVCFAIALKLFRWR
jgi:hypothetical protein